MTITRYYLTFLICITLVACLNEPKKNVIRIETPSQESINACRIVKSQLDLNFIIHNGKAILKGEDACVLSLLDSIANQILKRNDFEYIECLDSLYKVSDGYVSEYFLEIGTKLFYNKFPLMIKYSYRERNNPESNIEKIIIESLSMDYSIANAKKKYDKRMDVFTRKQFETNKLTIGEIEYAKQLRLKIDPSKFD